MTRTTKRTGDSTPTQAVADESRLPLYTVAAVAKRVGVPTATLRSWNQRYGIGPTGHRPRRHRLYSETDIAVVRHMRELIDEGANPRSAARAALAAVLPTEADTAALRCAAFGLDIVAAGRILDAYLAKDGVIDTWDNLVRPVFTDIETRQIDGDRCIDVEHMLSWAVTRSLQRVPVVSTAARRPVILACTEREAHSLPLEALRAALCERDHGVVMLGAAVPVDALADAVARQPAPGSVVLWSQSADTAEPMAVDIVVAAGVRLALAGPGWDVPALPSEAHRLDSLRAAVQWVIA